MDFGQNRDTGLGGTAGLGSTNRYNTESARRKVCGQ